MKRSWPLVIGAISVVAFLFFLSTSGKKPPFMPADSAHDGLMTNESCAPCHEQGKQRPLKETHPPKEQCVVCHRRGVSK